MKIHSAPPSLGQEDDATEATEATEATRPVRRTKCSMKLDTGVVVIQSEENTDAYR